MYITNHMIMSKNEKADIAMSFSGIGDIKDIANCEALFVSQNDDLLVGYAIINRISIISSSIDVLYFRTEYETKNNVFKLLRYILWELNEMGKEYLNVRLDDWKNESQKRKMLKMLIGKRYQENCVIKVSSFESWRLI